MDDDCHLCSLIKKKLWTEVLALINQSGHLTDQDDNQSERLLDQDGMAVSNVIKIYLDYLENKYEWYQREQKTVITNLWKTSEIFDSEIRQNVLKVLKSLLASGIYSDLQLVIDESLPAAVRSHDEEIVLMFLKSGADPNKIDKKLKINSFGLSIDLNNIKMVQLLFNYGAKVNEDCGSGQTPLGLSMYKNIEVCKFLLRHGAEMGVVLNTDVISNPVELFHFPIFNAVYAKNTFLVQALLENGANVNESFKDNHDNPFHLVLKHGTLPLHLAIQQRDVEMVKMLIKYGASLNEASGRGHTPLGLAMSANEEDSDRIVEILLASGCSCQKETILFFFQRTYKPIFIACFMGKTHIVKQFLEVPTALLKETLDMTASDGSTPLFMAAHENHLELVKYLLSLGADPHFTCFHGNLVHAAVHSGNVDILALVLSLGCAVDWRSEGGNTSLMLGVMSSNLYMCELLVKQGALLNVVDRFHYTPLLTCVRNDKEQMCCLLLQHGADVNVADSNGQSPLYWSVINKNEQITRLLLLSGAMPSSEEQTEEITSLLRGNIIKPKPLLHICVLILRTVLATAAGGRSIEKCVMLLPVGQKLQDLLLLK